MTELVKMVRSWLRHSGKYLALRMRMANSVDANQTAPREKKKKKKNGWRHNPRSI